MEPLDEEMKVRWLANAQRELEAELERIAAENEDAAVALADILHERTERLAKFPDMGRRGMVDGTRELVIERYPYIVPYRVKDNVVEILRVFHTSRKPPASW